MDKTTLLSTIQTEYAQVVKEEFLPNRLLQGLWLECALPHSATS